MPESPVNVCAVVPAGLPSAEQTRPPDQVVETGAGRAGLADAVREAAATGATWLWLVDPCVRPEPAALAELLAPLSALEALGDPVLFASKVVGADGRLDQDAPPWPRLLARELAMAGADHRLAALRAARYGSLLVHCRAVQRHGPPRPEFTGAGDDLEWTGRLLRDEPGYLVPRSLAVRERGGQPDPHAYAANRVRILRGDGWRGQEKAWFAFLFAQDLTQRVSARPGEAVGLVRALGRGLRDAR
jgi:GT2 family glycosyltransferase